jgi:hypothetical protein
MSPPSRIQIALSVTVITIVCFLGVRPELSLVCQPLALMWARRLTRMRRFLTYIGHRPQHSSIS